MIHQLSHNPLIAELLQKSTDEHHNYVSFVEVFDKEKRAKIAKQFAESLAKLSKIKEQNEHFLAVESGVIPAYEIEIDEDYEKSARESEKFMHKKQADNDKKYGWFK